MQTAAAAASAVFGGTSHGTMTLMPAVEGTTRMDTHGGRIRFIASLASVSDAAGS